MIFSGNRTDSIPGFQQDSREAVCKKLDGCMAEYPHAPGTCLIQRHSLGGLVCAAWGLRTCPGFTVTNDLNKMLRAQSIKRSRMDQTDQEDRWWGSTVSEDNMGASGDSSLRQCDVAAQPSTLPGSDPRETLRPRSRRAEHATSDLKEASQDCKCAPTEHQKERLVQGGLGG